MILYAVALDLQYRGDTMTNEEWRSREFYTFDPFAEKIQPALLNSADIKEYVHEGCLIKRDDFDDERLKTASYGMRFLGELHSWDTKNDRTLEPRRMKIRCGDSVKLPGNSITYLSMKEELLLPEYIAARFNLHIRHVHKGILLGTGPMVDPGFFGSLLIPLHNLTNNDYEIDGGEVIIWVEFTKLNVNDFWKSREGERPSDLKSFPNKKDIKDARSYLKRSGIIAKGGVQSAFKGVLEQAQNDAENASKSATDAREETRRLKNLYTWIGLGSASAIILAAVAAIFGGYTLVNQVLDISNEIHQQIEIDRETSSKEIDVIQDNIANLETKIDKYRTEVDALKLQIDLINKESDAGRNIAQ